MKMNILLIGLLFFTGISLSSSAQDKTVNGFIVYEADNPNVKNRYIEMFFSNSEYRYILKGLDEANLTTFQKKKFNTLQDSVDKAKGIEKMREQLQKNPLQQWYGTLLSSEVIKMFYESNTEKLYFIRDTSAFMEWQLLNDTATLHGLLCYKASGTFQGSAYIAWYTPSIPVSVAPLHYRGLPGLLIKCENITKHSSFQMKELQWPAAEHFVIAPSFSKGEFISQAALSGILNKQSNNMAKMIETFEKAKKEGKKVYIQDLLNNQ